MERSAVDLRLRAFTWLLAASIPAHFVQWIRPLLAAGQHLWGMGDPWSPGVHLPEPWQLLFGQVLLWLAAALLLWLPPRRALLLFFFAAALAHGFLQAGNTSNHWALFLFALGVCAVFPLGGAGSRATLTALRLVCALTYWFAALHKLNADYFNPATSWVGHFAQMILQNLPGLDGRALWLRWGSPFIVASVCLELSLPILLWLAPLRRLGCLLGLVFHGSIALCQHGDYSQLILSFYVLFFEEEELSALLERLRRFSPWRALAAGALALVLLRISYLQPLVAGAARLPTAAAVALWTEWALVWAFLACCGYLALPLASRKAAPGQPAKAAPGPIGPAPRASQWTAATSIVVAAYAFNCLGPYTGFQLHHAQAMFSNLEVMGGNHWFIPRLHLFHNDEFAGGLRVEWGHAPGPALLAAHPDLQRALDHRGRVHLNHIKALFAHACAEPGLKPIAIAYQTDTGDTVSLNPCDPPLRATWFHAYPWLQ